MDRHDPEELDVPGVTDESAQADYVQVTAEVTGAAPEDPEENGRKHKKKKKKKHGILKFLLGVFVGILICIGVFVGLLVTKGDEILAGMFQTILTSSGSSLSESFPTIETKLKLLQSIIDEYYLDEDDIDEAAMIEGIYKGYIEALDEDYTVYYTADEYAALEESTSGEYYGIGALVSQAKDTGVITIVNPFEGAPAETAGMEKGDILYKVEGQEVTGMDLDTVVAMLKGDEGTEVEVEVYRESINDYVTLNITRGKVEVPMVESEMLDDNIGYVQVTEFESTTADQFDEAVDELLDQGMQGLVIDLRDNPGGLLSSAQDLLDRILPKGDLLVYTEDKNGEGEKLYAEDDDTLDIPITVLINGNSASASEVVSGCLQDYGVATLVGTTSFGKGIVQYVLPLGDGSAIKLTSASYYSPKGRNIHGKGLDPDVEVENDDTQDGDEQLQKAEEVLLEEIGQ